MAANLKLVFEGADKDVSITFTNANAASAPALVKALAQEIAGNGDIYAEPPLAPKSAAFHINTVVPVDIS